VVLLVYFYTSICYRETGDDGGDDLQ